MRCKKTGERRDEVDVSVVLDRKGQILDVGCLTNDPEIVPEPLHQGPGYGNRPFEGIDSVLAVDSICHCAEKTGLGRNRIGAGIHQHEVSGAVGVLGISGRETDLPEQGRLLITENRGERNAGE